MKFAKMLPTAAAVLLQLAPPESATTPGIESASQDTWPDPGLHVSITLFRVAACEAHAQPSGTFKMRGTSSVQVNMPLNAVVVAVDVGVVLVVAVVDVVGVLVAVVVEVDVEVVVLEVVELDVDVDVLLLLLVLLELLVLLDDELEVDVEVAVTLVDV